MGYLPNYSLIYLLLTYLPLLPTYLPTYLLLTIPLTYLLLTNPLTYLSPSLPVKKHASNPESIDQNLTYLVPSPESRGPKQDQPK